MMLNRYHIAQLNVARMLHPLDDPRMAGFVGRLADVNALADRSPGFVWRLQDGEGNATGIRVADDPDLIVNMSVWESVEALFAFVYRSAHVKVMARRREWFARPDGPYQVLWWVAAGERPTVAEAFDRLRRLDRDGPTPTAFTFKERFPSPAGDGAGGADLAPEPHCVGWS